ncbi:DUF3579 domain-containing protein [Nitrosomonas ureae]|uniref:DUF3579 domain-containing protein n=1 Tax=Nitrosomonas ureae TaxID=44577 RepID=A0A286A4N9_9PROT|nr:DUF3579 domain-containing protein [Nitrosomonas ureae]SOD16886.1 Protein of unknown function [Nitrosomonas ureae]
MKIKYEELLILGITIEGRPFRPSDWSERLCGALAVHNCNNRWEYSEYAQPVIHEGKIGVHVKTALKDINPVMYQFMMDFAYNNQLRIIPTGKVIYLEESPEETEVAWSVKRFTLALLLHQWKIRFKNNGY